MMVPRSRFVSSLFAAASLSSVTAASTSAEEARWLAATATWGVTSYARVLMGEVTPYADDESDRFFIYAMGAHEMDIAVAISEASLDPSLFAKSACGYNGSSDPEDPRCAKLTLSGHVAPCATKESCKTGKQALFLRHPEMKIGL